MVEDVCLHSGMMPFILNDPECYRFIIRSEGILPTVLSNYRYIEFSGNLYYRVFRTGSLELAYDELLVLLGMLVVCDGVEFYSVYNVSICGVEFSDFVYAISSKRPIVEYELSLLRDMCRRSGGRCKLDELVISVVDDYSIL